MSRKEQKIIIWSILIPPIICILLNIFTDTYINFYYTFLSLFIVPILYIVWGMVYFFWLLTYDSFDGKKLS